MSEGAILDPNGSFTDIETLRSEVKSLKDANKALSLYASKIIDRIISQEGFEHVLAVDYTENKSPTSPRKIGGTASKLPPPTPSKGAGAAPAKKAAAAAPKKAPAKKAAVPKKTTTASKRDSAKKVGIEEDLSWKAC